MSLDSNDTSFPPRMIQRAMSWVQDLPGECLLIDQKMCLLCAFVIVTNNTGKDAQPSAEPMNISAPTM